MFDRSIIQQVREQSPIVHSITNYVTMNDCANIILACGASPIMAEDSNESEEITALSNSLVINIGTLKEQMIKSMIAAGKKSNELNHPVILDPVGAGASMFRTDTVRLLMSEINFSVIRGNISEIRTIYYGRGITKGVDADSSEYITEKNLNETIEIAMELADKTSSVISITGPIDVVADKNKAYLIYNGNQMMSSITGSGCMLTSVIAAFCAVKEASVLDTTAAAVCAFGVCGELAYDKVLQNNEGTASYKMHLIDSMSKLESDMLKVRAQVTEMIRS